MFRLNQGPGFKSSLEHTTTLKLLGRVCRSFKSYNAQRINLQGYASGGYPITRKKKYHI